MEVNTTIKGITVDDNLMNLSMGWFVVYNNGQVVTENEVEWSKVKRGEIRTLGLKWRDKFWTIVGKSAYLQFKRGSVGFSGGGKNSDIECIEHCIGYYEGKSKIIYRVNHYTGQMRLDVRED